MTVARDDSSSIGGSQRFGVVPLGYDQGQVAETIKHLHAELRQSIAERDAAVARSAELASKLSAVRAEVQALRRRATAGTSTFEGMGERISSIFGLAQAEAQEMRRAAEEDAAQLGQAAGTDAAVRERIAAEERAAAERRAAQQAEVDRRDAERERAVAATAEQLAAAARLSAEAAAVVKALLPASAEPGPGAGKPE